MGSRGRHTDKHETFPDVEPLPEHALRPHHAECVKHIAERARVNEREVSGLYWVLGIRSMERGRKAERGGGTRHTDKHETLPDVEPLPEHALRPHHAECVKHIGEEVNHRAVKGKVDLPHG